MMKVFLGLLFGLFVLIIVTAFWVDRGNKVCDGCDIVLVTVDVWNAKDQNKLKITDNQKGYFFDNAFASSTWTLPVYASIFLGDYPANHGVWRVGDGLGGEQEGNFVSRISKLGYATNAYSVGPFFQKEWGFARDFDHFNNMTSFEEIKSVWNKDIINTFSDEKKDFYWIRLGMDNLIFDYQTSIDQTLDELSDMLSGISNDKVALVVVGGVGKLSELPDNESIAVPLFVSIPGNQIIDRNSVFETKDIPKLILQESEFVKSRQNGKSLVALSSSSESLEKIRKVYADYSGSDPKMEITRRTTEWSEPSYSSSRSLNWHLIRDIDGNYYLYDMVLDKSQKNNLFNDWNSLPADQRSEAIKVIRSIGSDVPEACGIYCGSHEFFK